MLTIEFELLTGRYVAQQVNDRAAVEWPPHPARFFSALVASSGHVSRRVPAHREVLQALENLPAPHIIASNIRDRSGARTVNSVFVPVNDTDLVASRWQDLTERLASATGKKADSALSARNAALTVVGEPSRSDVETAAELLPAHRPRKERTFPSFAPDVARFWFSWPDAKLSATQLDALGALLDGVTALGHSSSQVRCALVEKPYEHALLERFVPRFGSGVSIRWVAPGQLERLDAEFERHQGEKPRVLPSWPVSYGIEQPVERALARSQFEHDGWLLLEFPTARHQGRIQGSRAVDVAKALHGALAANASQPAPEIITGRADGKPTRREHLALFPLPDVGHSHAHGGLMGIGIVFPRSATENERLQVIDALGEFLRSDCPLTLPRGAVVRVKHSEFPESRALHEKTWAGPARRWATVTPVALDRHPGDLSKPQGLAEAAKLVGDACERIGLPRPRGVELSLNPFLAGSHPVRDFDVFPREPGRLRKLRVHALLEFAEPVVGPVSVGAGRFVGLGLFRPLHGGES